MGEGRKRGHLFSLSVIAFGLASLMALCTFVPTMTGQGPGPTGAGTVSGATRDWTQDMQMKIPGSFTLASVGDVIIIRPASTYADPDFQSAIKIIRDADVGFGNFESLIRDELNFTGPLGGSMVGTKEVAPDLMAMGFKIMNRAGNHLFDSNQEGLFETTRLMQAAGLVYGGVGRDLEDARATHFLETPKGRIGVVGMFSETAGGGLTGLGASYRVGNTGGRPGLNAMNLTRTVIVTPDQLDAMKKVRDAVYEHRTEYSNPVDPPGKEPADQLVLFGTRYKAGATQGQLSYAMNPGDLRDTMRSIRNGKEYSDFMIAAIHAHEGGSALQESLFEDVTPDFLVTLAHDAIDNGADAFEGSGPHLLRGIEIYKGKPIFYDLGEFFREWDWSCDCDDDRADSTTTSAERAVRGHEVRGVVEPVNYESVIALSKYDKGMLLEVRLYPIESRQASPISQRGIPRIAPPDTAQRILQRLQKLSEPFGTKISIEGNVGVIRVAQ
jgi:hypothetical protein